MSFDIDTLIKKFSHSNPTHFHQHNKLQNSEDTANFEQSYQSQYFDNNSNNNNPNISPNLNKEQSKYNETNKNININYNKKQIEPLNLNQISNNNHNSNSIKTKTSTNQNKNKLNLTTSLIANSNNLNINSYNTIQPVTDAVESSSSSSSTCSFSTSSSNNNNLNTHLTNNNNSDKAKFFNTLKSLFAIFDPECNGYIDINELDILGANKNEILNDVLKYLRSNLNKNSNTKNLNDSNFSSSPENLNHKRSSTHLNKAQVVFSPLIQEKIKKLKQSNKDFISDQIVLPSSSQSEPFNKHLTYVNFDEFVRAAEIVLENRKQSKQNQLNAQSLQRRSDSKTHVLSQNHHQQNLSNRNSSGNCDAANTNSNLSSSSYTGVSSSLNNLKKSLSSTVSLNAYMTNNSSNNNNNLNQLVNKMDQMQSTQNNNNNNKVFISPVKQQQRQPKSDEIYPTPRIIDLNKYKNYSTIPIATMISSTTSSSSASSTPTSASLSPSSASSSASSANSISNKHQKMHATTLSQAFDTQNNANIKTNSNQISKTMCGHENLISDSSNMSKSLNDKNCLIMNNANSCDFNILIDKEYYLLEQGIDNIELIKQWYLNQLKENKLKQANIQKLKHQNLFGIDKMLTDLKQLNDLNEVFNHFLKQNQNILSKVKAQKENVEPTVTALPAYNDYIEQYDLNKKDNELDKFLKEKQEKIDFLQKEKSQLIRKLFEMKSESANLNKCLLKLHNTNELPIEAAKIQVKHQENHSFNEANSSKVIPIKIESRYNENAYLRQNSLQNQPHETQSKQINIHDQYFNNNKNNSTIFNFIELPTNTNIKNDQNDFSDIKIKNYQKMYLNNQKNFH